jgi:dissimilatory sulfite reductase (desulfoviridin) alpha/beta subunit
MVMGLNTTVIVHNDSLHIIAQSGEEFSRNLVKAILEKSIQDAPVNVPCLSHCNAAEVIESHHADMQIAIIVGGNTGQVLGYAGHWSLNLSKPEDRIKVLRNLADGEGYVLRKKPTKKV